LECLGFFLEVRGGGRGKLLVFAVGFVGTFLRSLGMGMISRGSGGGASLL
jgi:hypothetical protein